MGEELFLEMQAQSQPQEFELEPESEFEPEPELRHLVIPNIPSPEMHERHLSEFSISGNIMMSTTIQCTTKSKATEALLTKDDLKQPKLCLICLESRPEKRFIYFKEKWMVGQKCCMQNFMCDACTINAITYRTNTKLCCPFCRNPVSHIETHCESITKNLQKNLNLCL